MSSSIKQRAKGEKLVAQLFAIGYSNTQTDTKKKFIQKINATQQDIETVKRELKLKASAHNWLAIQTINKIMNITIKMCSLARKNQAEINRVVFIKFINAALTKQLHLVVWNS